MFQLTEFFRNLPRVLFTMALVASGLVALFVAWWIAAALLILLAIYVGVRRLLARGQRPAGPEVIEGEFEKVDEPPERLR
jgi:hypothetical protein